jgi:hydrogenase-4 component F
LATVRGADGAASPQADGAASPRAPEPAPGAAAGTAVAVPRGEPSAWMVVPVLAGALVLLVLGVHPPADLISLLARAVRELSGVR